MTNPEAMNEASDSESDEYGIMGILKAVKIDDMPPPMVGVEVEEYKEEKVDQHKKDWIESMKEHAKDGYSYQSPK